MEPIHQDEMVELLNISIKYCDGNHAKNSSIDLYDLSMALNGFHRSLALTTHYFLHHEIITKAPFAKDVQIISTPPVEGSFEIDATVLITGAAVSALPVLYKIGTAPKDTVLGHIVWSLYDLVIHKSTGQHVDWDKSLYFQSLEKHELETNRIESLAQKVETSVKNIHRPIKTRSALSSSIAIDDQRAIALNSQTLDLTNKLIIDTDPRMISGRVAGYSANTRSGMVYSEEEKRAIPFELERGIDIDSTTLTKSLVLYDTIKSKRRRGGRSGFFKFNAKRVVNQAGTTKRYYVTYVYTDSLEEYEHELK